MRRYILTGAPGAGKTELIRLLAAEGQYVVEEAATDVIAREQARGVAEPWTSPKFIDDILTLQRERQLAACGSLQFCDRSPVCTLALARWLRFEPSEPLRAELDRIQRERVYDRRVLFVQNLGFVTRTDARRISFEDSLRFEAVHADAYRELGYELLPIPAAPLRERLELLKAAIG
ncbi:MAG: AAA family ATPase [Ignavibacteriales bacterium]